MPVVNDIELTDFELEVFKAIIQFQESDVYQSNNIPLTSHNVRYLVAASRMTEAPGHAALSTEAYIAMTNEHLPSAEDVQEALYGLIGKGLLASNTDTPSDNPEAAPVLH